MREAPHAPSLFLSDYLTSLGCQLQDLCPGAKAERQVLFALVTWVLVHCVCWGCWPSGALLTVFSPFISFLKPPAIP